MAHHKPANLTAVIAVAVALMAGPAEAADLTGPATIIAGDQLEIAGRRIMLAGIVAPEDDAVCGRLHCGTEAAFALAGTVERHWVECISAPGSGAPSAICRIGGPKGWDINSRMVTSGWARATDARYSREEQEAWRAGRGLWAPNVPTSP